MYNCSLTQHQTLPYRISDWKHTVGYSEYITSQQHKVLRRYTRTSSTPCRILVAGLADTRYAAQSNCRFVEWCLWNIRNHKKGIDKQRRRPFGFSIACKVFVFCFALFESMTSVLLVLPLAPRLIFIFSPWTPSIVNTAGLAASLFNPLCGAESHATSP